jgi:hypothetical protein
VDCVRFIRKTDFEQIHGFDENLNGPEDWDMDKKIRMAGKVELLTSTPSGVSKNKNNWELADFVASHGVDPQKYSGVIFHNESEFRIGPYLKKKNYYAKGFGRYREKWGPSDPDLRRQFGFFYRFIGVFVEQGKWKKMLRHPILTVGMYSMRFFVGSVYLYRRGLERWTS